MSCVLFVRDADIRSFFIPYFIMSSSSVSVVLLCVQRTGATTLRERLRSFQRARPLEQRLRWPGHFLAVGAGRRAAGAGGWWAVAAGGRHPDTDLTDPISDPSSDQPRCRSEGRRVIATGCNWGLQVC